jgi:hypothetical protein
MIKLNIALIGAAVLLAWAAVAPAAVVVLDDFESYNPPAVFETVWPVAGTEGGVLSTERYVSPIHSYKTPATSGGDGSNYRNLGGQYTPSDAQPLLMSFYMSFDSGATRQYNQIRGYSGAGYGDGSLEQLYAVGTYSAVTAPGEVWDGTKYQARVTMGTNVGWFNLNAPGAPSRSPGWHLFEIEIRSAAVNFHVDGMLGRSWSRGTLSDFDCVVLGSGLTNFGAAWTDDLLVEHVPEPVTLAMLTSGLVFVRRRRMA